MSPVSSDDKRVGDETLQRIDDLAGGWSLPTRSRGEDAATPARAERTAAPSARATPSRTPALEPAERARAARRKAPARDKTKAKGKERGKSAAAPRRAPSMLIPALLRPGRGTEQPPEPQAGAPRPARATNLFDDRGLGTDDSHAATQLATRVARSILRDERPPEPVPVTGARLHEEPTTPRAVHEAPTTPRALLKEEPTTPGGSAVPEPVEGGDTSRAFDGAATAIFEHAIDREDPTARSGATSALAAAGAGPARAPADDDIEIDEELYAELDEGTYADLADARRGSLGDLDLDGLDDDDGDRPAEREPAIEASTARQQDETVLQPPGSGVYAMPVGPEARKAAGAAVLRLPPSLPRRRGALGDLLYIYTAAVGLGRARRELVAADRKLAAEKQARLRRLADLARLALADMSIDEEVVAAGREEIMDLEDRRSRSAGAAAGADAAIAALERERADEAARHAQEREAARRRAVETQDSIEPLQRRLQGARRRAARLQEAMDGLDRRTARLEARLGKLSAEDRAAAEANLASLRAEREATWAEVPEVAAEIDQLEPAIAGLIAASADHREAALSLEQRERDGVARTQEKVAAVIARRVVDERAEAELAHAQEETLRALGERLAVDRPAQLAGRLRGIDEHEVAIATLERRQLELSELVRSVDRWAVVRGVAWVMLLAAGIMAALILAGVAPAA